MKKQILLTTTYLLCSLCLFAQKLPDVQKSAVKVPNNIRIDGINKEWTTFGADNKRTNLFYTITNDSENLYLIIKSSDNQSITKIIAGGISFTVNTKGKKNEKEAFKLTYPLIKNTGSNNRQGFQNRQRFGQNQQEISQQQRDSIQIVQRRNQLASVKEIDVRGFNSIADTLISIYNEYGIKAVAKIDNENTLFCEIAIPLKQLDLSAAKPIEIAYQIKLNGRSNMNFRAVGNFGGGNRGGFGRGNMSQQDLWVATDFWGKYKLSN